MTNNRYLLLKMREFHVNRHWVAAQLKVDRSTVDRWLQPRLKHKRGNFSTINPSYRKMPNMAKALLDYRLADEEVSKEC